MPVRRSSSSSSGDDASHKHVSRAEWQSRTYGNAAYDDDDLDAPPRGPVSSVGDLAAHVASLRVADDASAQETRLLRHRLRSAEEELHTARLMVAEKDDLIFEMRSEISRLQHACRAAETVRLLDNAHASTTPAAIAAAIAAVAKYNGRHGAEEHMAGPDGASARAAALAVADALAPPPATRGAKRNASAVFDAADAKRLSVSGAADAPPAHIGKRGASAALDASAAVAGIKRVFDDAMRAYILAALGPASMPK